MVSVSNFNGLKDNITTYLSHGKIEVNKRWKHTEGSDTKCCLNTKEGYAIIHNFIGNRKEIVILWLDRISIVEMLTIDIALLKKDTGSWLWFCYGMIEMQFAIKYIFLNKMKKNSYRLFELRTEKDLQNLLLRVI